MQAWWDALSTFEKIFWYISVPFSVIFLIQLILTFAGLGGGSGDIGGDITDGPADVTETDHAAAGEGLAGFHFFTLRNFIAFFTVFGWTGIACVHAGLSQGVTISLAVVAGLLAMLLVSTLFYFIFKLSDNGNLNINNAIGQTGQVYLPVRARASNTGKIQVSVQGSLREMDAITHGDDDLATGTMVKVTGITGGRILIVEKLI